MATTWRQRLATLALERGGLLSLAILVLYLVLAPSFITDGDNAEFSTLAMTGGAGHPPGYPAYVLYLRAMSWLPAASGAHAAALATAIVGGATAFVLHQACRAWGARPAACSIAVAIVSGAPVVLRLHTSAEVFAMNDLVAALVIWLAAAAGPLRGVRRALVLALVAGLGLADHHTCALLAPVGLLGVVRGIRESDNKAGATAAAFGGLLVGLSPYLYLFGAPHSAASWGNPSSFSELLAHFTRKDYGGIGAFSPVPGEVDVGANLRALAMTLGRAWLWAPAVIALGALVLRSVQRSEDGEPRSGWIALAITFLLAGPLLIARFNVPPVGIGLFICQRFHLLAVIVLTVPAAAALDAGFTLARRVEVGLLRRALVRELVAVAVFGAAAGASLPHLLETHSPAVEKGVVNILQSLPPDAVVLGTADDLHFGALYVQQVRGIRKDVDVITWPMTTMRWYREQFAARGLAIDPHAPGDEVPSLRVARQLLASGRPLFVEISMGTILQTFESYPHGVLFRVLPPGTHKPDLDEILRINRDLFAAFDLAYPRPSHTSEYAAEMHQRYARTWDILARALAEAHRPDEARDARELVHELVPTP
ncbi:MAG TPA: DUF2723 domain-containing protein [Kofleriaceae bacterium]|nr:DUF2723 domain-containing protein [Kofleriaceae bacterium]